MIHYRPDTGAHFHINAIFDHVHEVFLNLKYYASCTSLFHNPSCMQLPSESVVKSEPSSGRWDNFKLWTGEGSRGFG